MSYRVVTVALAFTALLVVSNHWALSQDYGTSPHVGGTNWGGSEPPGGASGTCEGWSDLWCESFEETNATDCESEGGTGDAPDTHTGTELDCDDTTEPTDGSENVVLGPDAGEVDDDILIYGSQWTAEADDVTWVRACFHIDAVDGSANWTYPLIFRSGGARWQGSNSLGALYLNSSTADIKVCCPDNFTEWCGASYDTSINTNYELTFMIDDDPADAYEADIDLYVDGTLRSSCDGGDLVSAVDVDGIEFYADGDSSFHNNNHIQWDEIRVTAADPGATVGCP